MTISDSGDQASPLALVVDDDDTFTMLVCLQLGRRGYPSAAARSADLALAQIERTPSLKAVICDAGLPGGGLRLVDMLRSERPDLAVIVVSGKSRGELLEQGLSSAVQSVQKPVRMSDLVSHLITAGLDPEQGSSA